MLRLNEEHMKNVKATTKPKVLQLAVRAEDSSSLQLYSYNDGTQELTVKLTEEVRKWVLDGDGRIDYGTHEILLAKYFAKSHVLTTYPCVLKPNIPYFSDPKYGQVRRISFEDSKPIGEDEDDGSQHGHFHQFPSGFIDHPFDGFGMIYMLRFIVESIEQLDDVDEIIICKDKITSVNNRIFRLPESIYHTLRKTLGRTHRAAVNFANEEKRTLLHSELVVPNILGEVGSPVYRRTYGDLNNVLANAINTSGRKSKARSTNESAAVQTVTTSARELITDYPEEIFELNREIELVTLEDVIAKFEAKLVDPKLTEGSWQKFLSKNPFILRLAFGLPAIVFREQMPVGGMDLDNKGGKFADFVIKSGALGNLAIVEIKTPKSNLLGNREYRGGVFAPSVGISGAVSQVIDQRYLLQKHITMLLANSRDTDASTYAVGCIVIAGTTPTIDAKKKSFELFRNNLAGVVVITFDELLDKLKALHNFLVDRPQSNALESENEDEGEQEHDVDEDEDFEEN